MHFIEQQFIRLKMKTTLLIFLSLALLNDTVIGQPIPETKVLITDLINNYGHSAYKIYGTYADKVAPGDLRPYFDVDTHELSRILITERCSNTAPICVTNFFDLKGIETIAIVKEGNFLIIKLKVFSEYLSVHEERIIEEKITKNDTVLIFFGPESKEQAERLKKAFIHLSKSYGGQPRDI